MPTPPPVTAPQPSVAGLFSDYQAPAGFYDEVFDEGRRPRPHWAELVARLGAHGEAELTSRWESGRRILINHGVTYNATEGDQARERPWELDLAPFVLSPQEWDFIERGAIQRARVQNLILQDLYHGPQRLLRDGFLPPALAYANPNFIRSCRGIPVPKGVHLHLSAIDLARGPDGCWWALDDRMQAPSGIGYALENRAIISRLLPQEFRALQVHRPNPFFAALRQTLTELAPSATMWPRIVLLTPGAHSPAHYEHALLARFLGFTLVEGGDLTVRDQRVLLKTVEGLQRVDVILRRVNDAMCDPLELREDSLLGVPGLMQAARAGNVLLANALGSAAAETPALLPTLPLLCRHLLGEDLLLPSTETWWCGEAAEKNHVLNNLDSLIIKRAFPTRRRETNSGSELSPEEQDRLRAQIQRRPHQFVAQTPVPLSHAPVWSQGRFEARPIVLRIYVAARGDSYVALPGGLTKVSPSSSNPVSGLQFAGGSKDTWILGSETSYRAEEPMRIETRPAERMLTGAPSRIADNLFWLGRYSERLEHTAHLIRAVASRLLDEFDSRAVQQIVALTRTLNILGVCPPPPAFFDPAWTEKTVLDLVYDAAPATGFPQLIARIQEIAAASRDRFSGDTWRIINGLRGFPGELPESLPLQRAQNLTHDLVASLASLSGMEMENMTRGVEWRFLDFGRRLERAHNLSSLFQAAFSGAAEDADALLNPILEICDSSMTYRHRYFSKPEFASVLDLLLCDKTNPRAVRFQLGVMAGHLRAFARKSGSRDELDQLAAISEELAPSAVRKIARSVGNGDLAGPAAGFQNLADRLLQVSVTLEGRYFNLVPPRRNIGKRLGS